MSYRTKLRTLLDEIAKSKLIRDGSSESEQKKKMNIYLKRTYAETPEKEIVVRWRSRH